MENRQILVPGKNCWRRERADHAAFIVDADAYFQAFRESLKLARKNIFICGWDLDSRISLLRNDPRDGYPVQLGEFLNAVVQGREDVRIFILIWDFVRFMGMDREWFPQFKLGWNAPRNIHFHLDSFHPVGASHHHKLVVVDDSLAFVGGLDLTKQRWDTTGHHPHDQRRETPDGDLYRPHHDVQMMVSGRPAQSLGAYFRDRWKLSVGREIPPDTISEAKTGANWPATIEANIHDCTIGIARTRPPYKDLAGVYEIEQLYLDSIEKAEDYIYIENQYLTSLKITRALAECLQKENGPEVVLVLPYATDGWLSQYTMDALRSRSIQALGDADRNGRLGMYYAYQEGLEGDDTIKIHSKLMIIDDRFVRIGSSNLNNRSMGFDTECDLALEVDRGADKIEAVRQLRNRLLGEHLGVAAADVAQAVRRTDSLLQAIKELRGNSRSLEKLEGRFPATAGFVVEEQELFDPERPIEPEIFIKRWLPVEQIKTGRFRLIQLAVLLLLLLGGAAAWRFTPLQDYLSPGNLKEIVAVLKDSELARVYVLGAYVLGSLLMVPITVLITLTILVFGIYDGFIFAVAGAVISSIITYWLGRVLGRDVVRSLAGNKVTGLSQKLGRRGILSTFVIRLMPIAPYSVVNIVAGASHIRFTDFIIGTVLGLLPGIFAIAGIVDRGSALLSGPDLSTILSAIAVIAGVVATFFFIQKKFREK